MILPFTTHQLAFVFRLVNAEKDKLLKMHRIMRPGTMQHSKPELIRMILQHATLDLSDDRGSARVALHSFRLRLCEEKLAEYNWFGIDEYNQDVIPGTPAKQSQSPQSEG